MIKSLFEKYPFLALSARTLLLLCFYLLVTQFMKRGGDLSAESYAQPYLVIEVFRRLGAMLLVAIGLGGVLLAFFGAPFTAWTAFEHGTRLRWFITFLAFLMVWPFAGNGYNFYFEQGYYLDRVLLVLLLSLLWWRPVFILPLLLLVFSLMGQFAEAVPTGSILEHKLQVLRVLNLFAAWFVVHAVTGSKRIDVFLLLTCCLVAAAYWLPALAKFQMHWLTHGQLYHMPLTAYGHGWLGDYQPSQIVDFAQFLSWFDWPMRLFVFVFEAAFLIFLLNRKLSLVLLGAIIAFHFGVFVLMGFFFWTWILLDFALLVLLWKDREKREYEIYGSAYLVLSVVLILGSDFWAKPPRLGWYDTRVGYTYRLDGITESGQRYRLPPRYFAPYEDVFTMATFSFLVSDHTVLSGPYGVTHDAAIAKALMPPVSARDLFELEHEFEARGYHPARSERLANFVVRYVGNRNAHAEKAFFPTVSLFPPQFWSQVDERIFAIDEPVREVVITEVTSLYDDKKLEVIRELEVLRLSIPAQER